MGERKVVSKYIPPDFDPALVPRGKKLSAKDGTVPVRMMLPFSVQCDACHTFLYRGRKFNSKKEAMGGPEGVYLGITRWRFYIKCTHCSRPLTFLTDPKNADYEMESGGTRNYEITKDRKGIQEDAAELEEKEAKEDPLKALETRVLDSQREMADLDNLEEIRAMNARHLRLFAATDGDGFGADTRAVLNAQRADNDVNQSIPTNHDGLTAEDEALVKSIHFGKQGIIRRLGEDDEKRIEEQRKRETARLAEIQRELASKTASKKVAALPVIRVKRKRLAPQEEAPKKATVSKGENGGLAGLLGGYGSDSD
jgi:hypothetical protein